MEKQIKKIESSLMKIERGIKKSISGDFINNELIYKFLSRKQDILRKTRKKLIKINELTLISWNIPENDFIS